MAEPFIGQISMFAGDFPPRGWAFCEGQLLPILQNSALFSVLGTTYGGDGQSTFGLPDLRGRAPIHKGNGPGLPSYSLGEKGGEASVILNANNLPAHTHPVSPPAQSGDGETDEPGGAFPAKGGNGETVYASSANTTMGTDATGNNTTSNQALNNMPPYLAINYIIALVGIFPSRP